MLTYGGLKQHILLALGGQPSVVTGVTRDQRIAEIINQAGNYLFSKPWKYRERTARPLTLTANQNWASLPGDAEEIITLTCKAGMGWRVELTTPDHIEMLRTATEPALLDGVFYAAMSRPWAQSNGSALVDGSGMPEVRLDLYPTPQTTTSDAVVIRYRSRWVAVSDSTSADYQIPVPAYVEALLIAYARAFGLAYEDEGLSARLIEIDNGPLYNAAAIKDGIQQRDYGRLPPNRVGPFRRESNALSGGMGFASGGVILPATAASNVRWRGSWNANDSYVVGDIVRSGTVAYIAVIANSNSAPPSVNWEMVVQDGAAGSNGSNGVGVPIGGTQYQVLAKTSATDYATAWMHPVLSYAQNFILADITMSSASTWYDAGTVTLTDGTWHVSIQAVTVTSTGTSGFDIRIRNATDSVTIASGAIANPRATGLCGGSVSVIAVVTGSKSFRCQVACVGSTAGTTRANAGLGDFNCTGITAVRIA